MSSVAVDNVCASCGITGGDDINLKVCTACRLVKYCSVDCQKNHRSQHKRACKQKVTELRDEILFKQPENSHLCSSAPLLDPGGDEDVDVMNDSYFDETHGEEGVDDAAADDEEGNKDGDMWQNITFALPKSRHHQIHVGDRKQNPDSRLQFSMNRPCVRAFWEALREDEAADSK